MRGQALIAALLVLLAGTVRFCPSCAMAQEEQKPLNAHACCEKESMAPDAPASSEQSAPAQDTDCPRASAGMILQAAALDLHPDAGQVDALAVAPQTAEVAAPVVAFFEAAPVAIDTSPPLTLQTPIRI